MTLKINPIIAILAIAGILILVFALFRGCKQSRMEVAAKEKAQQIADSALAVLKDYKARSDSTSQDFKDSLDISNGRLELAKSQNIRLGNELQDVLDENKKLIAKHNAADYSDTTATIVPAEYLTECEDCFTKLETTTNLSLRYKSDLNNLQGKWDQQDQLYQKRFKQLNEEKLGFYNKMNILAKEQKEVADKLKPHGRLYLSWGVLWAPWPVGGGAGLMYQTKFNFQYGAKVYYGRSGTTVETSMHFPLSIKIK